MNALHAAGREKALAVIGEFLRVTSYSDDPGREGTFLVMRTLFDAEPNAGAMPPMRVGEPAPPQPTDSHTAPRFPILLEGDIPFLGVLGYSLAGMAEPPENHLAWFRAHGTLRSRPLRPTDQPLETLDRLLARYGADRVLPTLLVNQLLALLDSVHRVERGADGLRFAPEASFDSAWRDLRAHLAQLKIRWHPASLRYVFAGGTALPEPATSNYRRVLWPFELSGGHGRVAVERRDRRFVRVAVRAPFRHLTVRGLNASGTTLQRLAGSTGVSEGQGDVESFDTHTVALPEGEALRIEIEASGTRVTSPELRP